MNKETLLENIDKIHTTKMGVERIKRNLMLDTNDVVESIGVKKSLDLISKEE